MKTEASKATTSNTLKVMWCYDGEHWAKQANTLFKDEDGRLFLGELGDGQTSDDDIPMGSIENCNSVSWRQVLEWFALVDEFADGGTGDIGDVAEALLDCINAEKGAA